MEHTHISTRTRTELRMCVSCVHELLCFVILLCAYNCLIFSFVSFSLFCQKERKEAKRGGQKKERRQRVARAHNHSLTKEMYAQFKALCDSLSCMRRLETIYRVILSCRRRLIPTTYNNNHTKKNSLLKIELYNTTMSRRTKEESDINDNGMKTVIPKRYTLSLSIHKSANEDRPHTHIHTLAIELAFILIHRHPQTRTSSLVYEYETRAEKRCKMQTHIYKLLQMGLSPFIWT